MQTPILEKQTPISKKKNSYLQSQIPIVLKHLHFQKTNSLFKRQTPRFVKQTPIYKKKLPFSRKTNSHLIKCTTQTAVINIAFQLIFYRIQCLSPLSYIFNQTTRALDHKFIHNSCFLKQIHPFLISGCPFKASILRYGLRQQFPDIISYLNLLSVGACI